MRGGGEGVYRGVAARRSDCDPGIKYYFFLIVQVQIGSVWLGCDVIKVGPLMNIIGKRQALKQIRNESCTIYLMMYCVRATCLKQIIFYVNSYSWSRAATIV